MENQFYRYDEGNRTLIVTSDVRRRSDQNAVKRFCADYRIDLKEFNQPVVIQEGVQYCVGLFRGCASFNQLVVIPQGVVACDSMFGDCVSFNQKVGIPDGVESCARMFENCKVFNQPVTLPDSVKIAGYLFRGCTAFNERVKLSNSILFAAGMFCGCEAFNQPVTLSGVVDNCGSMFCGCKKFNQPVVIPDSVTFAANMFQGCVELNASVELCVTSSLYCDEMFADTPQLQKGNVTAYCTQTGQKGLSKALKKMWGTEVSVDEVHVCEKKRKRSNNPSVLARLDCVLTGMKRWEMTEEELAACSRDEVFQKIEAFFERQQIALLEIEEKSQNSMRCLSVNCEGNVYAIGIVDEWDEAVYYYNSGKAGENVAIRGNLYPGYMVSGEREVVYDIIKDFLKNGKPSGKVKWKKE